MKILIVATVVKTHIMEFHIPYLKMLKEMGWETAVAARNDYENKSDCSIPYCDSYYDIPFERNPFKPGNFRAYKQLKELIDREGFDIIHCHTPVGGVLGRLAARKARKHGSKVFYTAHGFHFYKGAPLLNWLLYYPVEKMLAGLTDVLITINSEDYGRAQSFSAGKVIYLPGVGIDTDRFSADRFNKDRDLRSELGIPQNEKVILSVGEATKNKNHRSVIEVMPQLDNVHYVICGSGQLIDQLKKLTEDISVSDRVIFAGYRTDLPDFYHMADAFVFPSFREGLPVALMEAMASGLVCVAARNRGTNDLLPDSRLRFDPSNKSEILDKIRHALEDDNTDEVSRNREILSRFRLENVLEQARHIYLDETEDRA